MSITKDQLDASPIEYDDNGGHYASDGNYYSDCETSPDEYLEMIMERDD